MSKVQGPMDNLSRVSYTSSQVIYIERVNWEMYHSTPFVQSIDSLNSIQKIHPVHESSIVLDSHALC